MQGLAALLFPAVLMLFALAMEKLQDRFDHDGVDNADVDQFLADTAPEPQDPLSDADVVGPVDELKERRVATSGRSGESTRAS
ncbi:hypothetical protein [Williamsia sterculiae]|uniref:Uncharacterized protein n=1 Tax=Williamsia sterculiae TaxID=1344003 RepID=A0A1N7F4C8_9NOCA|nr:hypothetical protein [Williamsia sterculiae]SIR95164.1 hypothetical protein SAMN05445060_1789 [Williamsia sterculiae]